MRRPARHLWFGAGLVAAITLIACLVWYTQSSTARVRLRAEQLDGTALRIADLIEDRLGSLRDRLAVADSRAANGGEVTITRIPLDGSSALVPLSALMAAAGSGPELGQPGLTDPYQLDGQWYIAMVAAPDPRGTLAAVTPLASLHMQIDDIAKADAVDVLILTGAGRLWWSSPHAEGALALPATATPGAMPDLEAAAGALPAAWQQDPLVAARALPDAGLQVVVRARNGAPVDFTPGALILLTGAAGIVGCFALWRMQPPVRAPEPLRPAGPVPETLEPRAMPAAAAPPPSASDRPSTPAHDIPFLAYAVQQEAEGAAEIRILAAGDLAAFGLAEDDTRISLEAMVERVANDQQRDLEDYLKGKAHADSAPPWLDWQRGSTSSTVLQHFPFRHRATEQAPARITGLLVVAEGQFDEWSRVDRAAREANAANTRKSRFLARLSHEMRTPLNAIIGFAELMEKETLGPVGTPRYRDYLADIGASGRHLHELINDIIDISRVETGELDLSEAILSVGSELEACVRFIRERLDSSKLDFVFDVPEGLPKLRADPLRFRQIMLNLLSNAIKFTKPGGEVGLSARVTPDNALRISVVDTGIGMDEAGLRRALEPFGRVSDERYGPTEGTGLGLPIARGLMALHGGQLEIESAPGAGTTVNIVFPSSRLIAGD